MREDERTGALTGRKARRDRSPFSGCLGQTLTQGERRCVRVTAGWKAAISLFETLCPDQPQTPTCLVLREMLPGLSLPPSPAH